MFAGAALSGVVVGRFTLAGGGHDWRAIWLISALAASVVLILFALVFKDEQSAPAPETVAGALPVEAPL